MSAVLWLLACGGPAPVEVDPDAPWTERERATLRGMRHPDAPPGDPTNALVGDERAIALGEKLFFDPALSPRGDIACSTCHDPELNFADARRRSRGMGETARHAPTIPGTQWGDWFAWDGKADSQWSQAAGPLEHPAEMGSDRVFVVRSVLERYPDDWAALFGETPDLSDLPDRAGPVPGPLLEAWETLSDAQRARVDSAFAKVLKSIGAYEHTLVPGEAAFDRYVDALAAGDPSGGGSLGEDAERGLKLFMRRGNCVSCHSGPMFMDRAFHNLGLPEDTVGYDPGRTTGAMKVAADPFNCAGPHSDAESCPELEYLNPTFDDFVSAFKTPSLRNVTRSAPYMHNGVFATLDDVLAFYSELPGEPRAGHRELTLVPLELTDREVADLEAFLAALEGT